MSSKISGLLKQINIAAKEVLGAIKSLDEQIATLDEQRRSLGDAPVSRADFLEYIGAELDRQAGHFSAYMGRALGGINKSFSALERGHIPVSFLLQDRSNPLVISEPACFWYLKPAVMARMEELTEGMDFDDAGETIPVEQRRVMIAGIDAEIQRLRNERDELASQLEATGMIG